MKKRQFKTFIANSEKEALEQLIINMPIRKFSRYLAGRVDILFEIGEEFEKNLDKAFPDKLPINAQYIDRAESLLWLWILGAYEVVRTMHQAKDSFSLSARKKLEVLKEILAEVRMPAAKMEKVKKGREKIPIPSNRNPAGIDCERRDLLLFSDPIAPPSISARYLLAEFDKIISPIKPEEIIDSHENSYNKKL